MKRPSNVSRIEVTKQPSADSGDKCYVTVLHLEAVQRARSAIPASREIIRLADLLTMLANPTRLRILLALLPSADVSPELCVCDLAVVSDASKSMTSHQLRLLRTAGLVTQRREGKLSFYRLENGPITELLRAALQQERKSLADSGALLGSPREGPLTS